MASSHTCLPTDELGLGWTHVHHPLHGKVGLRSRGSVLLWLVPSVSNPASHIYAPKVFQVRWLRPDQVWYPWGGVLMNELPTVLPSISAVRQHPVCWLAQLQNSGTDHSQCPATLVYLSCHLESCGKIFCYYPTFKKVQHRSLPACSVVTVCGALGRQQAAGSAAPASQADLLACTLG